MPVAIPHSLINCQSEQHLPTARGVTFAQALMGTLGLWRSRFRERHAFPVLDDRELRDMRLSRWDVERELGKPFWRG